MRIWRIKMACDHCGTEVIVPVNQNKIKVEELKSIIEVFHHKCPTCGK